MDASAASDAPVRYEREGAVALITLDRPRQRNAIDAAAAEALHAAYQRFVADDDALVLVLTGAGGEAFSAGADLKGAEAVLRRNDRTEGPLGISRLHSPKPTIAAIDGWCLGGGLELALWCDLRIAGEGSRFGCAQRRFGAPLIDGGTQRLARTVGRGRALELVITGRIIDTAEAARIELVTEVVASGRALERALALAAEIAALPQEALLADRRSLIEGFDRSLDEGLALESRYGGATIDAALAGAARFASGEGRGGRAVRA